MPSAEGQAADPFGGHEFAYESHTDLFRCTCTDDTAPHYEDWYPVRLPGTGPRRAGGPEEAQDG